MSVEWTDSQKEAIKKDGNLVVSAGAGSGKTAVLVEKVIRLITGNNVDVDDILVVTFTKAATADVKEKIISALYDRIALEPDNKHLQRQVTKVGNSSIDTINAFCLKLVKRYFDRLNVSCNFRIFDENESQIIKEETLENCITVEYEKHADDDIFKEVVGQLCERRSDDGLKKAVMSIFYALETTADEQKYRRAVLEHFEDNNDYFEQMAYKEISGHLENTAALIRSAQSKCEGFGDLEKVSGMLSEEANGVELVRTALDSGFNAFSKKYKEFSFGTMRFPNKFDDPDFKEKIKAFRDAAKKSFGAVEKFAVFTSDDIAEDKAKQRRITELLFEITDDFREMLSARKADMAAADFSDVEKLAFSLLTGDAETAEELSRKYKYIFVDEYQDTNELQNSVFKAISSENNSVFFVGDVKQSIYGFRSACPELFAQKIDSAGEGAVFLNHNFRSRKSVTEGVNGIFRQLMTKETGGIDYDGNQELRYGAEYYTGEDFPCELHFVTGGEEDEFRHIVRLIKKLVTEENYVFDNQLGRRRAKLRDIAVLMRSPKRSSAVLEKMLCDAGLSAYAETQPVFFTNEEIVLATSMLEIVDNPTQDTHFAAVLASPIGRFTEDELVKIRLTDKKTSFYGAFKKYAEKDEKAKSFLEKLETLRVLSLSTSVAGILTHIYDEFSLMTIAGAMKRGNLRKTNLRLLLEYATEYENTGFKGIFNFNLYLRRIKESGREMSGAKAFSDDSDVVRIMSMHKSKGLEYPIVILAQANVQFNLMDTRDSFIVSRRAGIGMKLRDNKKSVRYDTLQRLCLSSYERSELVSEEIRLWYVAMTRARERLIVTSSLKRKITPVSYDEHGFNLWSLRGASSPISMIYSALQRLNLQDETTDTNGIHTEKCAEAPWIVYTVDPNVTEDEQKLPAVKARKAQSEQQVRKNLEFIYPYSVVSGFPAKTSVSSIKKLIELKKDERAEGENLPMRKEELERPDFIKADGKLSAAERGTALHSFLQYAEFEKLSDNEAIDAEIKRLCDGGFISKAQADSIDKSRVQAFGCSRIMQEAVQSGTMQRERRFNIKADIGFLSSLTGEELAADPNGLVIMQGVIDCLYEKDGRYTVLDYKTDAKMTAEQLREKYSSQLMLYAYAIKEITGCNEVRTVLYSFSLGEEIII